MRRWRLLLVDSNSTGLYSTEHLFPDRLTEPNRQTYLELISRSALIDDLANGRTAFTWTQVEMLSDSPAKTLSKHRKALLEAGVLLYELKPAYSGFSKLKDKLSPFGSSASSLHAKMFAIDDKRLFIGSFNFDPRSININTELGFVIESADLTSQINQDFAQTVVA